VWLDDSRKDLRLADTYRRGTSETFRVVTANPDAELELVKAECEPSFMHVSLDKLNPASDRGYYSLIVQVEKESKAGPWSGMIVLELKGKHPQRIRVQVLGKGG
jgi:hypothetical protein